MRQKLCADCIKYFRFGYTHSENEIKLLISKNYVLTNDTACDRIKHWVNIMIPFSGPHERPLLKKLDFKDSHNTL